MKYPITEDQIERFVEQAVNVADRSFMSGKMTQAEYDARMKRISQWADDRYSER